MTGDDLHELASSSGCGTRTTVAFSLHGGSAGVTTSTSAGCSGEDAPPEKRNCSLGGRAGRRVVLVGSRGRLRRRADDLRIERTATRQPSLQLELSGTNAHCGDEHRERRRLVVVVEHLLDGPKCDRAPERWSS